MANDRIYRLRRAILMALFEYESYQDLDTIMNNLHLLAVNPAPAEVRAEWDLLIGYGFLQPLPGYNNAVCRLNPSERVTIEKTHNPSRDERLWGFGVL